MASTKYKVLKLERLRLFIDEQGMTEEVHELTSPTRSLSQPSTSTLVYSLSSILIFNP